MSSPLYLLTPAEVADALRLSQSTVYHLIRTGELRAFRCGRHLRIHEGSLADLIERGAGSLAGEGPALGKLPAERAGRGPS